MIHFIAFFPVDIIQCCSWEYAATMIDQIGDWDIWDDYPEK